MRPTSNNLRNRQTIGQDAQRATKNDQHFRETTRPGGGGSGRPSTFMKHGFQNRLSNFVQQPERGDNNDRPEGAGRPSSFVKNGPQNRLSNIPPPALQNTIGRPSELPQRTTTSQPFDEYSSSDHYRLTHKQDNHIPRTTTRPRATILNNQEFSRCSIDSLGSHRTSNEDSDEDLEGSEGSQNTKKRRIVVNFRGTGQNGQVLKEDMKNWSRKLHKQQPQDLYQRIKIPKKSIFMSFAFLLTGITILISTIQQYIETQDFDQAYLKLIAGIFSIIPGLYNVCIWFMIQLGKESYSYEDIAQFETDKWWKTCSIFDDEDY